MRPLNCLFIVLLFAACNSNSSKNNLMTTQVDILDSLNFSDSDKIAINSYRKIYDSLSEKPEFDTSLARKIATDTFNLHSKGIISHSFFESKSSSQEVKTLANRSDTNPSSHGVSGFGASSQPKSSSEGASGFGAPSQPKSSSHGVTAFGSIGKEMPAEPINTLKKVNTDDPVNVAQNAAASYKDQHASEVNELADVEKNVNWIFSEGNNNPPTRAETYLASVSYFGYTFIRGWVDANTCGSNAVLLASIGRRDEAMSWLAAAQNHAPSVVDEFKRNYNYTIDYTLAHFGYDVLGSYLGTYFPGYNKILGAIQGRYSDYHPDPHAFDKPVIEDVGHGKN